MVFRGIYRTPSKMVYPQLPHNCFFLNSEFLFQPDHHLKFCTNFATTWVVSSVGLEHYLDRVGVTGSNPVQPTNQN